jgi:hypothetical protein
LNYAPHVRQVHHPEIKEGGFMDAALKNRIEKRAYEIFLHRGAQPGHHFDDWVKAEKEIMAEIAKEKTAKVKMPTQNRPPIQKKKY